MAERDGGCVCVELIGTSACPLSGHSNRSLSFAPLARLVTKELPCAHWQRKAQPSFVERRVAAN